MIDLIVFALILVLFAASVVRVVDEAGKGK